jgi:hypothetical protein
MHYENVLKPLLSRQQELENIVNKNANDYERKRAQDELDRIVTRRKVALKKNNKISLFYFILASRKHS